MEDQFVVVLITVPNAETGQKIATALVAKKLAACVNILPGVRSIYAWQGEIQDDQEVLLLVKTRASKFAGELVPAVQAVHPYEVPEIIALPVVMGSSSYLNWLAAETSPQSQASSATDEL